MLFRNYKKIFSATCILIFGYLFLFGNLGNTQTTYAANSAEQGEINKQVQTRTEYARIGTKIFYVLLRPAISLAGLAIDNSLVYGKAFGFDAALWNLRNITRNMANYVLGFLFLYSLFEILINKKQPKEMMKTIQNTLIAGIAIQASWFIMAAAVDISSLATYGIGGMPISIIENIDNQGDKEKKRLDVPVLRNETILPLDNLDNITTILKTEENQNSPNRFTISPCHTRNFADNSGHNERLILGREKLYYVTKEQKEVETTPGICHYMGDVYWFNDDLFGLYVNVENGKTWKEKEGTYHGNRNSFKATYDFKPTNDTQTPTDTQSSTEKITNENRITKVKEFIKVGEILQIPDDVFSKDYRIFTGDGQGIVSPDSNKTGNLVKFGDNFKVGLDVDKKLLSSEAGKEGIITLSQLFEKSQSYVGVFSALYSSLLDSASVGFTEDTSTYSTFLNAVINVLYVAVLLIPLLVLAVVLMARILFLWVIIAISPLIILFTVFKDTIKIKEFEGDGWFSLQTIGKILVAPVLVAFAVSLSTMFVMIIKEIVSQDFFNRSDPLLLFGLIEINIRGAGAAFSQLLIGLMGIGIVRFLLFWAIKMNKIGQKIGDPIQKFAENWMTNVPIIPLPTGGSMSLGQLDPNNRNGVLNQFSTSLQNQMNNEQQKAMADWLENQPRAAGMYQQGATLLDQQRNEAVGSMDAGQRTAFIESLATGDWNTAAEYKANYTKEGKNFSVNMTGQKWLGNADNIASLIDYADKNTNSSDKITNILKQVDLEPMMRAATSKDTLESLLKKSSPEQRKKLKDATRIFDGKTMELEINGNSFELIEKVADLDLASASTEEELKSRWEQAEEEQRKAFIRKNNNSREFILNRKTYILNDDKTVTPKPTP